MKNSHYEANFIRFNVSKGKIAQNWIPRFFKYLLQLSLIRRDNYENLNNLQIKVLIGENFVLYARFWPFLPFLDHFC